jgi:hypothetical protein
MLLRRKYDALINVTWDYFDQSNFYISRIHIIESGIIGVVRRGTIELFPGSANFGKTSQLFYYHMTNLIQSKSII